MPFYQLAAYVIKTQLLYMSRCLDNDNNNTSHVSVRRPLIASV